MRIEKQKQWIQAALQGEATLVIKNARIINVFTQEVIAGDIALFEDTVLGVGGQYHAPRELDVDGAYVCPGFIDSHVHIESSMATPARFASTVLPHGTTAVIADPHEIANVAGTDGIQYMLDQTEALPLAVYMMMPSCVPCTSFESSGATLSADTLALFLAHPRVLGLGELMDYVGAINGEDTVLQKCFAFKERLIDGHAPLLTGNALHAYRIAGPFSDHECSNYEEMLEKLRQGMHIQLRMGSAANGIEALFRRIAYEELPTGQFSFCTDDKHLEDIRRDGHINYILRQAVAAGISPVQAICMATNNAARAYGLKRRGAIAPGYLADFVVLPDLESFRPLMVFAGGEEYREAPMPSAPAPESLLHSVHIAPLSPEQLLLPVKGFMPVIELVPGQLVTKLRLREVPEEGGGFIGGHGLCKLAVLERHHSTGRMGLGILSGLNIEGGAIATTVAHDSHNLIVAGDNDEDMLLAVNALIDCGGGYAVAGGGSVSALLPLPIGGLMTDALLPDILAAQQKLLAEAAKLHITGISDPFITLSFLALPVIPEGRLTDQGVFQVSTQRFIK